MLILVCMDCGIGINCPCAVGWLWDMSRVAVELPPAPGAAFNSLPNCALAASPYLQRQVLNCGDAAARQYILGVLRAWAAEGVDGFCFINAENLVQGEVGAGYWGWIQESRARSGGCKQHA